MPGRTHFPTALGGVILLSRESPVGWCCWNGELDTLTTTGKDTEFCRSQSHKELAGWAKAKKIGIVLSGQGWFNHAQKLQLTDNVCLQHAVEKIPRLFWLWTRPQLTTKVYHEGHSLLSLLGEPLNPIEQRGSKTAQGHQGLLPDRRAKTGARPSAASLLHVIDLDSSANLLYGVYLGRHDSCTKSFQSVSLMHLRVT